MADTPNTPVFSSSIPDLARADLESKYQDTVLISGWLFGKGKNSQITYKKILKSFFEFHPNIALARVTPAHITVFLKDAEKRGLRPTSLNLYLSTLASLFRHGVNSRRLDHDPTLGIKCYRVQNLVHQKILTIEQIEQMLRHCPRSRDQLLIKMLFYLGLRASEATEILVSDFSMRRDGVVLFIKGKGSKIRQAPIGEDLWAEIENYVDGQALRKSDYLFTDQKKNSRRLSRHAVWKCVRAAARRAKINPMPSPHWFRHTCATLALEGGAGIHVVKERLGHASLSTTQIYLHAKASEGLGQYLPKIS